MNALLIVCGLGFISLLSEIFNLKKGLHVVVVLGLIGAALTFVGDLNVTTRYFSNMLIFDRFSVVFSSLIITVAAAWFCIARSYFVGDTHQTDRTALVAFTVVGGIMMVSFHNMAILFLGIEILSIALYVLAGSNKESFFSNEAAFKYFIMGSFATGFLLMGIALVYGSTGSFDIAVISNHVASNRAALPGFFYVGLFLLLIGISFKISVVPFHFWAPDVYAGSPTLITAFMSTVVKIAAVGAFYKIFAQCFLSVQASVSGTIMVIIILTLLVANITAVYQSNVKRMLAYSSVAQVGYILLGLISDSAMFEGPLFYYLASYAATSLIAFAILERVESTKGTSTLDAFAGLYSKNPFAAFCMSIALLSLAGIPPFAGFFAKYSVLSIAIGANHLEMVVIAIITSLIGVYYYFKPVMAMFTPNASVEVVFNTGEKFIIGLLTLLVILMGLLPDKLISILG
ncbi:MAG TPA: NADH-quinone oxidoreductase subunit N [Chryseolinea sp.]